MIYNKKVNKKKAYKMYIKNVREDIYIYMNMEICKK